MSAPKFNALSRDAEFWETQVEVYERFTGGCTRIVAANIAEKVTPPITSSSYILDSACGTGVQTEEIKKRVPDARIMATDVAPGMARKVETLALEKGWKDVGTRVQDMRSLDTFKNDTFTHVITNFSLLMLKEREDLVNSTREMYRVLQKGGSCVVTSWAGKPYLPS